MERKTFLNFHIKSVKMMRLLTCIAHSGLRTIYVTEIVKERIKSSSMLGEIYFRELGTDASLKFGKI